MKRHVLVSALVAVIAACAVPAECQKTETSLGLYVTAKEAYDMWQADPGGVKILDVRTLAEFVFVGHPPMAYCIPAFFQTHEWDPEGQWFVMKPNPEFVAQVKRWAQPTDTILVTCRSGERAAMAIEHLAEAGFENVYNIVDGMEGGIVDDPESVFHGRRMKNGWQNSGLPWTYELDPERIWMPENRETTGGIK